MTIETIPIAVWPDGCWCYWDSIHGMGEMEEDPSLLNVPIDSDHIEITRLAQEFAS